MLHVKQLDHFWHEARPLTYGAEGAYTLPVAIERFCSNTELIEISSYRKRILSSPVGVESKSYGYPGVRELSLENFENEAELSVFLPKTDNEFLVAQPLYFEHSIIGQYEDAHKRRDILDYASLAVELGVLDSDSASGFLEANHFIPGGFDLGIYPRLWLVETLSKIELVARQFVCRNGSRLGKYDGYQIRAVGFLSERLGSYFIIRHLMEKYSNNIPADIFGHMTVMVEGNAGYSVGLSDQSSNRLKR
ncbi:hypothetical protein [Mycobacterium alsense]|uniref:hypothetical protein n=1 Tax=Mycobacterium alsense TaxID=324058 RepID=UPI001041DDF5|nr:hypothetical protein [Mycobacterium alsense]